MVFMVGEVEVITKDGERITGDLMPYEDAQAVMSDYPIWNAVGDFVKDKGVFLFTGKTISFIRKGEISSMKSLRYV